MSNSHEQMSTSQRELACNDSSSLQQTERFTAGTTWKLARISRQTGLVVRYLGLSATPTRICGAAVSGATKELYEPGSPPQVPCFQGLPFLQAGTLTPSLCCAWFPVPVPCDRIALHAPDLTGLDSVLGGTTDLQRQRHSRHVSGRPASATAVTKGLSSIL